MAFRHRSALIRILAAISIATCLLMSVSCSQTPATSEIQRLLTGLEAGFDASHPGRGLTDYPSEKPEDIPKAYAMVLLGAIDRARLAGVDRLPQLGLTAGMWLLDHRDENRDGVVGWGVPIAWDAYGDGSVNPAHTEYTISTAIVVHALLDWMEFAADAPRQQILAAVTDALRPYIETEMQSPSGMAPYSLTTQDRRYDTFNPAAYLAGQMQRFSQVTTDAAVASALRQAADTTVAVLIAQKRIRPDSGAWYWGYSVQEATPNDLPHASYIIDGIATYLRHGGRLAPAIDIKKVVAHLEDFLDRDDHRPLAWPFFRTDVRLPARLYDVGIALRISCGDPALAAFSDALLRSVASYRGADERYYRQPIAYAEKSRTPNRLVAEYEAYLYQGLATCALTRAAGSSPARR